MYIIIRNRIENQFVHLMMESFSVRKLILWRFSETPTKHCCHPSFVYDCKVQLNIANNTFSSL